MPQNDKNYENWFELKTSSVIKESPFYHQISVKGKTVSALLSQMRLFDVRRLSYKQAKLSDADYIILKKRFTKMFIKTGNR
jgi:predicted ATPase